MCKCASVFTSVKGRPLCGTSDHDGCGAFGLEAMVEEGTADSMLAMTSHLQNISLYLEALRRKLS